MRRGVLLALVLLLGPLRAWAQFPLTLYEHQAPAGSITGEFSFRMSREIEAIEGALGLRLCKVIGAHTVVTLPTPTPIEPGGCAPVAVVVDASTPGDCSIGGGTQVAFCRSNGSTWGSLGGGFADTNTATICADSPAHITQMGDGSCLNLDSLYALVGHDHAGVYSPVAHDHAGVYALLAHNHDGTYSLLGHNHDALYALLSHTHDDRYFTETELSTPGTINQAGNPIDWTKQKNVPAGFADGVDNTGTGSAIVLDLDDNGANESTAITEIAVTGDTNAIFQESSPDKLLIRVGQPWPTCTTATTAGTATSFAVDPMGCGASLFMTDQLVNGTAVCAGVSFGQLAGTATDVQIPDNITVDLAAACTALASNPTNCASGQAAGGVTANGTAEACIDFLTQTEATALYALLSHNHDSQYFTETELGTNDGTANQGGDPVSFSKLKDIPNGLMLLLNAEIGPIDSAGTGFRMIRVPNGP